MTEFAQSTEFALLLTARTIDAPSDSVLEGFSCGRRGGRSELTVHNVLAQLRSGERRVPEVRVTEERTSGDLVGIAAIGRIFFPDPRLKPFGGSPFITLIALSEAYRGRGARGGGRHLGDFLLEDALRRADAKHRGGAPWIFAVIDKANRPSWELFLRHGFEPWRSASSTSSEVIFRRAKHLQLSAPRRRPRARCGSSAGKRLAPTKSTDAVGSS